MRSGTANCIDIILAIILPPLGVFLKFGCRVEFWICLLLTLFGYIPGIIYALMTFRFWYNLLNVRMGI
ncbi:hypothetical protein ACS0TY_007534 [Phlomoides rotata]